MKKELATIKGQIDDELITIGLDDDELITIGLDDDNRLCASNGDDVHPSPRAYRAGIEGERQAIRDIEAMWGRDCSLEWLPAAEIEMNGAAEKQIAAKKRIAKKDFIEMFPVAQNRHTALYGWRRVNGCIDLSACAFATELAAKMDRGKSHEMALFINHGELNISR